MHPGIEFAINPSGCTQTKGANKDSTFNETEIRNAERALEEDHENDELVHETPAIVGCQTSAALAHTAFL